MATSGPVAYGYARVSTAAQADEGYSLEVQQKTLNDYITTKLPAGTSNGGTFVDKVTGKRSGCSGRIPMADRPAGGEMCRRLKKGDHVVMVDLPRAFRNFKDAIATLEGWMDMGVVVHLVRDQVTTATPHGRLFVRLMSVFAQMEREMAAVRTAEVMQHRKRLGHAAGAPTYGKRYAGPKGQKVLVDDEEEVETMREIVRLYTVEQLTYEDIWRAFRAAGLKTTRGKPWSKSRIYRAYKAGVKAGLCPEASPTPASSAGS